MTCRRSGQGRAAVLLAVLVAVLAASPAWPADERERIAQERLAVEDRFVQARTACETRFVVTDCLDAARNDRRRALDALQQRQLVLDDARRRERAALRLQAQQEREMAAARSASAPLLRQPRPAGAAASAVPAAGPAASAAAVAGPAAPAAPGASGAAARAQRHRIEFDRRQQAARDHQQALSERQLRQDAQRPAAAGLPLPSASDLAR